MVIMFWNRSNGSICSLLSSAVHIVIVIIVVIIIVVVIIIIVVIVDRCATTVCQSEKRQKNG